MTDAETVGNALNSLLADMDLSEDECEGCRYFTCWRERHPYGNGAATETLVQCDAKSWLDCPRITHALDKLEWARWKDEADAARSKRTS